MHACLELATMAFKHEKAVKMTRQGLVPLTPADLAEQTGLSKQHVRRALAELEALGLAERRGVNGGPLHKGRVEIYSWAVPREPKEENGSHARLPFPSWVPLDSWASLLSLANRLRIEIPQEIGSARDSLLPEGEEIARRLQEDEMVARAFLERVRAQGAHNKDEITERTIEKEPPPTSPPVLVPEPEPESQEPAGRPDGLVSQNESLKPEVQKHLETFAIPRLTPETIAEVVKHIDTPELLDQYKEATSRGEPRTWGLLIRIAKEVAQDGQRLAMAKAAGGNGHSPPRRSKYEQEREAYIRGEKDGGSHGSQ